MSTKGRIYFWRKVFISRNLPPWKINRETKLAEYPWSTKYPLYPYILLVKRKTSLEKLVRSLEVTSKGMALKNMLRMGVGGGGEGYK